ncbi:hypothetical protein FACHB389_20515 [Nostoc calcicola FACHB-389]|nr:hypothetical protein FACHB389_20515 [Nostoc calcicola FACHB-389]
MEIGVKPLIRYVKIKPGYKRSLPLTTREAAFRGLGVLSAHSRRIGKWPGQHYCFIGVVAFVDFPEGSDFSQQALWAASRWVN